MYLSVSIAELVTGFSIINPKAGSHVSSKKFRTSDWECVGFGFFIPSYNASLCSYPLIAPLTTLLPCLLAEPALGMRAVISWPFSDGAPSSGISHDLQRTHQQSGRGRTVPGLTGWQTGAKSGMIRIAATGTLAMRNNDLLKGLIHIATHFTKHISC